ncbi:hypothetical protein CWC17_13690 [Pseudoalteromonas sp. S3785]|uniref:hypothetical protein n=1 Tax=Pseudoalteromonas sp. S3785 TaxID=579545 RepID=UPI00110A6677|nr:hypothetical protein [Pseudoalteromonas sp. S3785]TMO72454.1 hypothetical protein CWC17_13690 [Pseudoalteromonas sp. S3785]
MQGLQKLKKQWKRLISRKVKTSYNKVYEQLVDNDNDLVGQIAYCIYKQSKQNFIKQYKELHNKDVSQTDLDSHVHCSELPNLPLYKDKAKRIMDTLSLQILTEKEADMTKVFEKNLISLLKNHDKRSWIRRHFSGGFSGLVGNTLTAVLLAGTLFYFSSDDTKAQVNSSAKANIVSGVAKLVGVEIEIKP